MSQPPNPTHRDAIKAAGAAAAVTAVTAVTGPFIQTVRAANDAVKYGIVGTGGRGAYLLKHLTKLDNGHCVAVCDVDQAHLDKGAATIGGNPAKYKDYREL